jgi:hypothetical protein
MVETKEYYQCWLFQSSYGGFLIDNMELTFSGLSSSEKIKFDYLNLSSTYKFIKKQ